MSTGADYVYAVNPHLSEELVARDASLERKESTMPYPSRSDHMFGFRTREVRLALRLPREQLASPEGVRMVARCVQHSPVVKQWVEVPAARQPMTEAEISQSHVGWLKPKPAKKARSRPSRPSVSDSPGSPGAFAFQGNQQRSTTHGLQL